MNYTLKQRWIFVALCILSLNSTTLFALAIKLPPGVKAGPQVEGISEYRLANGLIVLLSPDASKATTTVNITYKVGSLQENYGETGMAHLLEHLLFKGTPKHRDITAEMKKRGMSFNGTTWLDRTNFFESFSSDPVQLKWALELEADRMINSFISRKDLDSEMTVVRNEMEAGENNPGTVLVQRMASTAYLWHNYGKSTIGARSDVEQVSISRLQAFYRKFYQPDNAVLLVAGRFDATKTLAMISQIFGKIPKPSRILPTLYTVEPVQDGEREVVIRRAGDTQLAGLTYHTPPSSHVDSAALEVLSGVMANEPTGRLHKALEEKGKASHVQSWNAELREPGMLMYFAQIPQGVDPRKIGVEMTDIVENLANRPVTPEEVEQAKNSLLKGYDATLNDVNRVGIQLSESIGSGDWRLFFLYRDRIKTVTAADVNRVSAAYIKPSNRTLGLFIPEANSNRAEIPGAPDIQEMLKDYQGQKALAQGESFDPSSINIEKRTERGQFAFGAKYTLLTKKTRGQTVQGSIHLHFGDEKSLQNRATAAQVVGAMLTRGTKTMTRDQIATTLDKLKTTLTIVGAATGATVDFQSTREYLPAAMALIADLLRNSVLPESEVEQLRTQAITAAESQRNEPTAVAMIELSRHFNSVPKSDPRYAKSIDEMIADMRSGTKTQALAFYKEFYGANYAEFSFVGDFDAAALKSQINNLFGDWKSEQGYERVPNPYAPIAPLNKSIETADKANAAVFARSDFQMDEQNSDYPAMIVANYILGGGQLKSRLADRIRKKDGLSYGVGSQFQAGVLDNHATLFFYAISAPENVGRVQAAFNEEIARFVKNGVTQAEVSDAIAGILKSGEAARTSDANVANLLADQAYYGFTMNRIVDLEMHIKKLSVTTVNAALRRHIKPQTFSIVSAGDFAKKKQ